MLISHGIEPRLSLLENNMHPTTLRCLRVEKALHILAAGVYNQGIRPQNVIVCSNL